MQIDMKDQEGAGPVMRSMMEVTYANSAAIGSASRGLSSGLWGNCPCFDNKIAGDSVSKYWSAATGTTADWVLTQAASGTFAPSSVQMGAALIDSESGTASSGVVSLQLLGPTVFAATAAVSSAREIWFETRIRLSQHGAPNGQLLVGLCDTDTSLLAASAIGASNMLGFHAIDLLTATFAGEKATASANAGTAVHTFVTSSWVKLGLHVSATSAGVPTCTYYVDGVPGSATITSANIPVVGLVPSFAVVTASAAATTLICELDWVATAGKLGSSDLIATNA